MKKWIYTALALVSMSVAPLAFALTVVKQGPAYNTGQYEQTVVDIQVKVMGGEIAYTRKLKQGQWQFVRQWNNIAYKQVLVIGHLEGESEYRDDTNIILRNGYAYKLEHNSAPARYRYDDEKYISQSDSGFRWQDRSGEWIEYDVDRKIKSYGNSQGVIAQFVHNMDGQISEVNDRFASTVLTLTYENNKPKTITDHTGRKVTYLWQGGQLTQVTDVSGHHWLYSYDSYQSTSSSMVTQALASVTDPEARLLTINNTKVGGTTLETCELIGSDPGTHIEESVDPDTGAITIEEVQNLTPSDKYRCRLETIPLQVIFASSIDNDGHKQSYLYNYNGEYKAYGITEVDADGVKTLRVLSSDGAIIKLYKGDELVFSQGRADNIKKSADAQGNITTTNFDDYNNIVKITHPDGAARQMGYHADFNLLTRLVDENNVITTLSYNDQGLVTELTSAKSLPEQLTQSFEYNANQLLVTHTLNTGDEQRLYQFEYDSYGNLSKSVLNGKITWQYQNFNALGKPQKIIDGNNQTWLYQYDAAGRLTKETDPLNHSQQYSYDKVGNLTRYTDANSVAFNFTYNARNQLTSATDGLGKVSHYQYNAQNLLAEYIDELGKTNKILIDRAGRSQVQLDGNNVATQYSIGKNSETGLGRFEELSQITYPTYSQSFEYNNRQQMTKQTTDDGDKTAVTAYSYDALGRVLTATDANGISTTYTYDAYGNATSEQSAVITASYQYNAFGELIQFSDAKRGITQMAYDSYGRLITESRQGFADKHYQYDHNNNLVSVIDPKGQQIVYRYDIANRQTSELRYSSALPLDPLEAEQVVPQQSISYQYDNNNQLSQWQSGSFSANYNRDNNGRLLSETVNYPSFSKQYQYSYYDNGKVKNLTMPDGTVYSYEYDNNNQLIRLQIPGQGSLRVNEYNWLVPSKETLPGGVLRQSSYSGELNPTNISLTASGDQQVLALAYQYGQVNEITQRSNDDTTIDYQYDTSYRLIQAVSTHLDAQIGFESFQYDANADRTGVNNQLNWQYNPAGQLVSRGAGDNQITYSYDDNGNQSQKQGANGISDTINYHYDINNHLTSITDGNTQTLASYQYGPFGRRLSKTVAGNSRYYLYNQQGLIAEYSSQGQAQSRYGYRPDNIWGTSPVFIETGSMANPDNKQVYYYQNDHLGTPYKIIDNTGFVVWGAQFDSFGQAHLDNNNLIVNNFRFPGQYYDEESGLHYNWHRYYDPALGRYISSDPIGLAGGANRYGYSYQNPVIYMDVDGRVGVTLIAAGVGGVIGGTIAGVSAWSSGGGINDILTAFAGGAVTGMVTNLFGLQSILLRSAVSIGNQTASQMSDGTAVGCDGFDLSQIAVAGLLGAVSPSLTLSRNPIINHAVTQTTNNIIIGLF